MPMKLKSACLTPGCGAPVVYRGRCEKCAARMRRGRPTASQQGYGKSWQETRAEFLQYHERCQCADEQALRDHARFGDTAVDVDHVLPKAAGGGEDWGNLRAMCHRCHSRKTRRQQLNPNEG